jgi:hypothetical protein
MATKRLKTKREAIQWCYTVLQNIRYCKEHPIFGMKLSPPEADVLALLSYIKRAPAPPKSSRKAKALKATYMHGFDGLVRGFDGLIKTLKK